MKKVLSLFIALGVVVISNAQQVLVKDSTYENFGGTSVISYINTYSYDANCRLVFSRSAYIDSVTHLETNLYEIDYDYYGDGTKFHIVTKYWNPLLNIFYNVSRETLTYTANKYVATDMTEYWTGAAWINYSLDTYTYTASNKIADYQTQSWNGIAWINNNLESYTYTASNKIITYLAQSWVKNAWEYDSLTTNTYDAHDALTATLNEIRNAKAKALINDNQTLNTYDGNEYLIKTINQTWDTTASAWIQDNEITYYNNSSGLADSSIESSSDTTISKTYNTYYSSGKLYQSTSYGYYKDQLTSGARGTYFYDSTSTVYKDSISLEVLVPPVFDTFTPEFSYGFTTVKNTDGTISENDFNETFYLLDSIYYSIKTFYAYSACNSGLPLTLLTFTGQLQNNSALLQWQTANEINTAYFTVQRSSDGINFTAIGKVAASGNSAAQQNYNYTDADITSLNTKKLYYRLAETDKDGAVTYSKIINLNLLVSKLLVYISPNPVNNFIILHSAVNLSNAVITVTDMAGKLLHTSKQSLSAGNSLPINASGLAKGMYVVTVQAANYKQQYKIVK